MKTVFKILILYCLTLAILFSGTSCEKDAKREEGSSQEDAVVVTKAVTDTQGTTLTEANSETPPFDVTTPEETISEVTEPEETAPEESTTETTMPEPIEPEATEPNTDTSLEDVFQSTIPEETTTPEPPHKHTLVNGQCACGYVPVVESVSSYDNDNDGKNDVFYFSPVLPEAFKTGGVICFWAGEYVDYMSSWVGITWEDYCYYCRTDKKSYIVYEIEVAEAGIYEMAIHQKMKDCEERGAKITVNEGSVNAYSIQTSYQFATEEALEQICENAATMSSYMFGIELELAAGVNYIKIELASGVKGNQYFRDFYLVKTEDSVGKT